MTDLGVAWLAGYLEGEGTFSFKNSPAVRVTATDYDAVKKAGDLMGSHMIGKPALRPPCKQAWTAQVCGRRALELMRAILPLMCSRRSARIVEVLGLAAARPGYNRGSRCYNAKLTEEDIPTVRTLHDQGWTQEEIARSFGVSRSGISCVLTGKTWVHVTAGVEIP